MLMNRNCEISSIPKSSLFLARIPLTYKTPIDSSTNTRKKKNHFDRKKGYCSPLYNHHHSCITSSPPRPSPTNSYQRLENFVISLNDRLTDNRHGVLDRGDPHYRASWSRSDRYIPSIPDPIDNEVLTIRSSEPVLRGEGSGLSLSPPRCLGSVLPPPPPPLPPTARSAHRDGPTRGPARSPRSFVSNRPQLFDYRPPCTVTIA